MTLDIDLDSVERVLFLAGTALQLIKTAVGIIRAVKKVLTKKK